MHLLKIVQEAEFSSFQQSGTVVKLWKEILWTLEQLFRNHVSWNIIAWFDAVSQLMFSTKHESPCTVLSKPELSHSTYSLTSKHLRQNRTNHSNQGSIPGDERSQRNGWVSVNKRQTHRSEGLNQGRSWQPSGKSLLENCRGTLPSQWRTGDREHKKERRQILCQHSEPEVDVKCVTQSN